MAFNAYPNLNVMRRRYGVATTIPLLFSSKAEGVLMTPQDWTPAVGDGKIARWLTGSVYEPPVNTANPPAFRQNGSVHGYLILTAAEMQCRFALITIMDEPQVTAQIESYGLVIETHGSPSALIPHDYDLSNIIAVSSPTSYGALTDVDQVVYQSTAAPSLTWTILDSAAAAVDLTGATLVLTVYKPDGTTLFTRTSAAGSLVVTGGSNNIITASYTAANTAVAGTYRYTLDKTNSGSERRLAVGDLLVRDYRNLP